MTSRNARSAEQEIAIVGMACLFPKAPDVATYWENICAKVDAVGDPPPGREMEPFLEAREKTGLYCVRGGHIGDLEEFHPAEFGVMPSAIDGGEPDQFLALEVAHQTLLDAGIPDLPLNRERTEVILGRGTFVNRGTITNLLHNISLHQFIRVLAQLHPEHTDEELEAVREMLKSNLPPINAETAGGSAPSLVSGRVANRFDLKGLNCTLDAACASSLVAIEHAMNDLREGRCDAALVGGVQVSTSAPIHNMFAKMGALSRLPHLRPFDKDADGTMLGEGAGMMLLKRHADAERDGHRIYALVRAVGISSDGRAKAVLTPRVEGEELAVRRAYEAAGIEPATVGLIEAHGTAMPVGDETEIKALHRVFGDRQGSATVALGSVKSMISHLLPASGIAGAIKAALALYHKVLPPTIACENPNPKLEIEKTPFYLNTETRPWIHAGPNPRRAAVNAFGFGGINAHAVLEEHPVPNEDLTASLHRRWDTELVVIRGEQRNEIHARGRRLLGFLERFPDVTLKDVAYTMNQELSNPGLRLAIVASDTGDLTRKLGHALDRLADPGCKRIKERSGIFFFEEPLHPGGRIALLFPGEGSQYPGMLGDLCFHFPLVRSRFDLMERAFRNHPRGYTPAQFIFPPPAVGQTVDSEQQERLLWQMDGAVESVFVADLALAALLRSLGLKADIAAGHSAGEYSALVLTGATRVDSDASLVRMILDVNSVYQRLQETQSIPAVVLIAVGGADAGLLEELTRLHAGKLFVAMDNCHYQVVLSAAPEIAEGVVARLKADGALCNTLPFDRPYHTPLFEPAYRFLVESFPPISQPRPEIQLWSCATAAPYPEGLEEARRIALEQWIRPVRFRDTVEAMYDAGVRIFVEAGPRGNLTSFVNNVLRKRPYLATATNLPGRSGINQLHQALALLVAQGVPLTLDPLYARRAPERLDLERREKPGPTRRGAMKISLALPSLQLPADARPFTSPTAAPPSIAPATPGPVAPQAAGNGRDASRDATSPAPEGAAVREPAVFGAEIETYFDTMEQFLGVQSDLMQAFLAEPALSDHATPVHAMDEALDPGGVQGPAEARAPAPHLSHAAKSPPTVTAETIPTDATDETAAPGTLPEASGARAGKPGPLVGDIISLTPGVNLTARRRLAPETDLFLQHHTLGGRASRRDPALTALPIMPLTMTLEMAAEAALALAAGMKVVELRDIRANQWIDFDEGSRTLLITAQREAGDLVCVTIAQAGEAAGGTSDALPPLFEATARLAPELPAAPAASPFKPTDAGPSRWNADTLYKTGMSHGPSFQGVEKVELWGKDGVTARLATLPADGLFAGESAPRFIFDPALLDAAGQLVAFWNGEKDLRGVISTPFRIDSIALYGPPPPPHAHLAARARVQRLAPAHLRADFEVDAPEGGLLLRVRGWEDRCIDLPEPMVGLTSKSEGLTLSERWKAPEAPLGNPIGFRCRRVHAWPPGTFEGSGMIWQKQVVHLILSRTEREAWRALRLPPRARTEWLFARAAAKDAVCELARENHRIDLLPADVEITATELGRPRVAGVLAEMLERPPTVSIAHGRGIAVGIAAEGEMDLELGIDVERMRPLKEGFERIAFSEEDLVILEGVGEDARAEWWLRAWCAKEAAAKALGTGLAGKPRDLVLRKLDESNGMMAVEIGGEPARMRPAFTGEILEVYTLRENDHIVAVTTCRRSET